MTDEMHAFLQRAYERNKAALDRLGEGPRPASEQRNAGTWTYDPKAGAAYVELCGPIPAGGVVKTARVEDALIHFDYDADGRVVGIEIIAEWPDASTLCDSCERCTWNVGPDCGKPDHPHCPACGHCQGRHVGAPDGTTP